MTEKPVWLEEIDETVVALAAATMMEKPPFVVKLVQLVRDALLDLHCRVRALETRPNEPVGPYEH